MGNNLMNPTSDEIISLVYPMGQNHEAIPSGNITVGPGEINWKYQSRWENQFRPLSDRHNCSDLYRGSCSDKGNSSKPMGALGCWSNIYRVEGSPFTSNTGVEIKDMKVYGWNASTLQWDLQQHLPIPDGSFYSESFSGDTNTTFNDSVKVTSNSKIVILREKNKINNENCMFHPFSKIKTFDTKYTYLFTCVSMRKVKWDESGIDDRDTTRYVSNCGGDWWREENLFWHSSWQHNKGIGQPKMQEIPKEWKLFCLTNVPENWSYGFPTGNHDNSESITVDSNVGTLNIAKSPEIIVSKNKIELHEEETTTFGVKLSAPPNLSEAVVRLSRQYSTADMSPKELTFNSSNWQEYQYVTVYTWQDGNEITDYEKIMLSATGYKNVEVEVEIREKIVDTSPSIVLTTDNLILYEEQTGSIGVKLSSPPSSNVTVSVNRQYNNVDALPNNIVFTPQNWSSYQYVTIYTWVDSNSITDYDNVTFSTSSDYKSAKALIEVREK